MLKPLTFLIIVILLGTGNDLKGQNQWISIFNGKDLEGWFPRGEASWYVKDGILTGEDGMGHLYSTVVVTDFEAKGTFRISGEKTNSGFYFRATPPADNPDGFPRGYEAQICHNQEAHTGWLWKPGKPVGEATSIITRDGEWFDYRIRAVGNRIQFWVNDIEVMEYEDDEYTKGYFAIQGHNRGMMIEAKDLYYRIITD